tara:strand:+ start:901 stop:1479 length:579 start_codon:yes stop_codon:yes gene_type:complete
MKLYPLIHRSACATCGALVALPIDIIHTRVITNKTIIIKPKELGFIFIMCNMFALQNTIYENLKFISNNGIRGSVASLSISPLVLFIKIKKMYLRLNLYPLYKNFIFWTLLRETIYYSFLYTILTFDNGSYKLFAPFIANTIAYPFKIIMLKKSYPTLDINYTIIKKGIFFELLESSLGDSVALYLIYKKIK